MLQKIDENIIMNKKKTKHGKGIEKILIEFKFNYLFLKN